MKKLRPLPPLFMRGDKIVAPERRVEHCKVSKIVSLRMSAGSVAGPCAVAISSADNYKYHRADELGPSDLRLAGNSQSGVIAAHGVSVKDQLQQIARLVSKIPLR